MGRNLRWSLIPASEDFRRSQILSTRPVKPFSPIDPRCSGERVSELFGHAQANHRGSRIIVRLRRARRGIGFQRREQVPRSHEKRPRRPPVL